MEYGVGIHGEPGINREPLKTSAQLADTMVDALAKELELTEKDRVAVLVNGFGATPLMELYLFYYDVAKKLAAKNIDVARVFVGNYMTSIDMAGASLSILKLDAEIDALLNEPADTAAFKVSGAVDAITFAEYFKASTTDDDVCYGIETPVDYAAIEGKLKVKCSGGIRDVETVKEMIDMGVARIGMGVESSLKIYKALCAEND